MTFANATSVTGTGSITGAGGLFTLTAANHGTNTGGTNNDYDGFTAASSTSVTGAGDYDDTTSATRGMTFASATSVTGTGSITNAAGLFTLTAANRGTTTGGANRAYDGYTAASSTSV